MNRLYIFPIILLLSLLPFFLGCKSRSQTTITYDESDNLSSLDFEINTHPRKVIQETNARLALNPDSVTCFRLMLLKTKSMFSVSEMDSVKSLLVQMLGNHLVLSDSPQMHSLTADMYNTMGNYYSRIMVMDSANYYFKHAFVSARKSEDHLSLPKIAINVADSYMRTGRYDLASYWYWKSLSIDDSLKISEENRFPTYLGLAQVHMELQDFAACDSFYEKAEKSFDKMQPFEKHLYLNKRGTSYYYRKDFKTALSYFRRSQKLVSQWPHMEFEGHLTSANLGEIFLLLNEVDSAAYYLENCRDFFVKLNNSSTLYYIDTQLIELAVKQKNLALARKRIKEAQTSGYIEPSMLLMRNRYLQHYFEENGDYEKAYFYQRENELIDDSIRNNRIQMRSSEMALRYRFENALMQKEILIRQQENKMLRLSQWLYILFFGSLAMGTSLFAFLLYRRRREEIKLWDMQTAINSLRLDNVINRISPHFLFNVLNHEINRLQNKEGRENLLVLIRLLRKQLSLIDQYNITMTDELDFVKSFLALEKESLGNEFQLVVDVDKSVDLNKLLIPAMSINILVENAVKHSLCMKEGKRKLWIQIHLVDDRIVIKVCDNGGGFQHVASSNGTGTGLKVITRAIQLYNQYNKNHIYMNIRNVDLEDDEKGCEVSYSIPKDYKYMINSKQLW